MDFQVLAVGFLGLLMMNVHMKHECPSRNQLHMTFDIKHFETSLFFKNKTYKP
jgi:hypothetical protein